MGPTAADVTDPGPGRAALLLGTIAVATVAVAVIAVALTPGGAGTRGTASATTVTVIDEPPRVRPRFTIPTLDGAVASPVALAPRQRLPRQIASESTPGAEQPPARALPDHADDVIVVTEKMLYRLPWGALAELDPPDDAFVYNVDGHLLGRIDGDTLLVADPALVED